MEPFRVASTNDSTVSGTPVGKSTGTSIPESSGPGLYTHTAVKGYPMTVDKFALKNFIDSDHYPELKDQASKVEEWIKQQAKNRNLEDSDKSYEEVTKEIFKKIGESKNEDSLAKFKRLNAAIEAMQRLKEAKLPAVLDWNNLKADEIAAISEK